MDRFKKEWLDCDILCIVGPTASGKTHFAVECASAISSLRDSSDLPLFSSVEIISADSRQVYRGMDIGTGKDLDEYKGVPYHLIDIVPAGEKYNLYQFNEDFDKAYNQIVKKGGFPILCGGSGLYVESVCRGYVLKKVEPNHQLRKELEQKSMSELIKILTELKSKKNSEPHNITDFDTPKRAIRAIEIELANLNEEEETGIRKTLNAKILGITISREERNKRIDRRLQERLDNGMIEEVQSLLDSGIPPEDLIYYGLEYKYVTKYLLGEYTYDYMKEHLAIAIHQFAKRQMTWFRGMERRGLKIEWI